MGIILPEAGKFEKSYPRIFLAISIDFASVTKGTTHLRPHELQTTSLCVSRYSLYFSFFLDNFYSRKKIGLEGTPHFPTPVFGKSGVDDTTNYKSVGFGSKACVTACEFSGPHHPLTIILTLKSLL